MLLWVASVIGCAAFGFWLVVLLAAGAMASMFALAVYLIRRRAKIEAEIENSSG
jgi:hypothetical protein